MKKLISFVLLASCLMLLPAACSHAEEPTLGAPAQTAYEQLQRTEMFALGGVGFAGTTSAQELAFRQLAQDPSAESAFLALVSDKKSTTVGQLYGLLGLKERNSAQFEAQLPAFLADDSTVSQMSGCIVMTISVSAIAQQIAKRPAPQKEAGA